MKQFLTLGEAPNFKSEVESLTPYQLLPLSLPFLLFLSTCFSPYLFLSLSRGLQSLLQMQL